ncbi:MAG: sodium:proton exchanger [Deltaproteobacteria bacterium]|nr:MAG: sodium:proton exchanger [Deltaproteobacteria bacterium]
MRALVVLFALGALMHATRSFADARAVADAELSFGFLLLSAMYAGELCAAIAVPRLTGYLAAGVVAGPFVLDLVSMDMAGALRMVNGVAIALIALTAGGELSVRRMKPLLRTIRSMTVWAVLAGAVALTATVFALQPLIPAFDGIGTGAALALSAIVGVTLASQSPAVVMALLSETRADGPASQTMLALVVIADLVVIVLYALVSPLAQLAAGGGSVDVGQVVATIAWEIFGSAGIGLVIGVLLALFLAKVERGAVLFVVLVCAVVSEVGAVVHLDPLIVTLVAGIYLENVSRIDATSLIHELEAGSLPVYLVFFALAGAGLALDLLWGVAVPAAVIAVVRGAVFWWGCRRAARRTSAEPAVERYVWVGLLPQAGLALALALILRRSFASIGDELAALVLGVVALNQIVTPILLRIALVRAGEVGRRA